MVTTMLWMMWPAGSGALVPYLSRDSERMTCFAIVHTMV
jgi:hypothetical protein